MPFLSKRVIRRLPQPPSAVMIYNLITEWSGFTPLNATSFMFDHYINETSTLAWMNPGYDNAAKVFIFI
jgi:hypothetical protein